MARVKTNQGAKGRRKLDGVFRSADQLRDRGDLTAAFSLFLKGAKAGDRSCQLNVGYCYDIGSGTRPSRSKAFHWYRWAYRSGDASAANNIGTIWRDRQDAPRALFWFRRALALGDIDANLEIARIHLKTRLSKARAVPYLLRVLKSGSVTQASKEDAGRMLRELRSRVVEVQLKGV
jgi:TPR repeat protein